MQRPVVQDDIRTFRKFIRRQHSPDPAVVYYIHLDSGGGPVHNLCTWLLDRRGNLEQLHGLRRFTTQLDLDSPLADQINQALSLVHQAGFSEAKLIGGFEYSDEMYCEEGPLTDLNCWGDQW